ncbi:hypothetical protein [Streptomyces sp. AmelKG-A3]|uniref:hypothetical protein n=1 Tax=Streptomyces sp. AmelKG-A3 TaxID=1115567 RepID=UPI000891F47B|nr:hypothetical protein [Streptomyces sp. AmelKG-A3]SDB88360.1 hypothetical protein F558DRAFT_00180 [Streptomyces sp. AmelKG-A3]
MSVPPSRRAARLTAALALAFAALTTGAAPAGAAPQPMGRCTTGSGAVLAVDFSRWGGPIYRSCGSTPTTGYELLNQGGWRTTGTGHDGPAFICRIGYSGYRNGTQFPPPEQDDCVLTPPASAYWSYWHAGPGADDWEYSQLGAMLYKPKPGSVDLWIFGGTDIGGTQGRPQVTPDQLRAHNTRPSGGGEPASTARAPALPPGTDTGPAPVRTEPERPTAPTAPEPPESPSPTASPSPSAGETGEPSESAEPTGSAEVSPPATTGPAGGSGGDTRVVDAAPAADAKHDAGSMVPVVAGGALVLLVGVAAVFAARHRRRGA